MLNIGFNFAQLNKDIMDFKKLLTEISPDKNGVSTPLSIISSGEMKKAFIASYNARTGTNEGGSAYTNEALSFYLQVTGSLTLIQCKGVDLVHCFISCTTQGGSFDESNNLNYLFTTAIRDADKKVVGHKPDLRTAPLGGLSIAQNNGQVLYTDTPQLVWDCDAYRVGQGSSFKIEHKLQTPRPVNSKIIAGYVCITRFDGSKYFVIFDRSDFESWKAKSRSPNSPAWGNGVLENATSMIKSKILKHSLNFTPKNTRPRPTHSVNYDGLTEQNISEEALMLKKAFDAYGSILGAYTEQEITKFTTFEGFKGDMYAEIENRKEKIILYYNSLVLLTDEDKRAKCPKFEDMEFSKMLKMINRLEQINKNIISKPF